MISRRRRSIDQPAPPAPTDPCAEFGCRAVDGDDLRGEIARKRASLDRIRARALTVLRPDVHDEFHASVVAILDEIERHESVGLVAAQTALYVAQVRAFEAALSAGGRMIVVSDAAPGDGA
ncbi:MAG: hypothetical protein KF847_19810 [Pirellulales bacterium]|nr:hypothetical protein [Pirellulales bacterium]